MHLRSDNIDKADEVIKERFQSLLSKYQIGLQTLMRVIYYKCHKITFKSDGSYIDSPD